MCNWTDCHLDHCLTFFFFLSFRALNLYWAFRLSFWGKSRFLMSIMNPIFSGLHSLYWFQSSAKVYQHHVPDFLRLQPNLLNEITEYHHKHKSRSKILTSDIRKDKPFMNMLNDCGPSIEAYRTPSLSQTSHSRINRFC